MIRINLQMYLTIPIKPIAGKHCRKVQVKQELIKQKLRETRHESDGNRTKLEIT
jgi:hypothetical protein